MKIASGNSEWSGAERSGGEPFEKTEFFSFFVVSLGMCASGLKWRVLLCFVEFC